MNSDLNLYAYLARRMDLSGNRRTVLQSLNRQRIPARFREERAALAEELHDQARARAAHWGGEAGEDPGLNDWLARTVALRARWMRRDAALKALARQLRKAGVSRRVADQYAALTLQLQASGWAAQVSVAAMRAWCHQAEQWLAEGEDAALNWGGQMVHLTPTRAQAKRARR